MISLVSDSFKNFGSLVCLVLKIEDVAFQSGGVTYVFNAPSSKITTTNHFSSAFEVTTSKGKILLKNSLAKNDLTIFEKLVSTFETELQSRFYKAVIDHMDEGVVACDEDGTLTLFNQKTKEFHGLPEETIHADQWADHYDLYTADLKSKMTKESIPLFRAFSGETFSNVEMMIAPKGKSPIFIHSNGKPMFNDKGEKIGAIATLKEESQIKQKLDTVESRFHTIFLQSPLSIQICSRDGKTVMVNPAWKKLWGIPEDVIQNFILKDYNMLNDPNLVAHGVIDHIRRGFNGEVSRIPIIKYDVHGLGIEGNARSVEGWIYPLKDVEGSVREIVLIHIDVTEKERLVSELKQAVAQREEFISIASHELKTPITSMALQLQLLNKHISKTEQQSIDPVVLKKVSDITSRQLHRITHLVDDMLDTSRISSGKLAIDPKETDVSQLIHDVITRYSLKLENNNIKIDVDCPPNILAVCDAFRIEQVVVNLLTNAIRYGMNKPIKVQLKQENGETIIRVIDQGMGIAPNDFKRIFERFERATSGDNIGGLGLGLFISRQIMELHQGTLTAESKPGEGSTFTARWK